MDKTYEQKVNDWLNTEPADRNLEVGATLMLQGNRNRILHQNVLRKGNFEKVEYELNKIIGSDRVVEVIIDIPALEKRATEFVSKLEGEPMAGRRPDHEALPEDIKVLVDENLIIYRELRSLFERNKLLSEGSHTDQERLPFIQELLKHEDLLTSNWEKYDSYQFELKKDVTENNVKIDAKRVSANRKYLSENKTKILTLVENGSIKAAEKLKAEMQKRYNEMSLNGETFAADQLSELKAVGLIIGKMVETIVDPLPGEQILSDDGSDLAPAVTENDDSIKAGSGN